MKRPAILMAATLLLVGCHQSGSSGVSLETRNTFFDHEFRPVGSSDPEDFSQPEHSLLIYDGILLGYDRGEFGGKLAFHNRSGVTTDLLPRNVRAMFPFEGAALVITGLSHMGTNEGGIYLVKMDPSGVVGVRQLHELEGSPQFVAAAPNRVKLAFRAGYRRDLMGQEIPAFTCTIMDAEFELSKVGTCELPCNLTNRCSGP